MRRHNGMRPQDIAILLKIVALGHKDWNLLQLSSSLYISISEVSESLNRSKLAKLISHSKKEVNLLNLLEFLEHGIKYVFPQTPGTLLRGIPTAHSHPIFSTFIISDIHFVWPDPEGKTIGLAIEPLYPNLTRAIKSDDHYYELMALVDTIRVGKTREVELSVKKLKHHFDASLHKLSPN